MGVRFNTQTKQIELKIGPATKDIGALQKGADFCRAFVLGFELKDAVALLRMDDLYIDGFDVDDVKTLHGEHLARAIGRMVGKDGQTKYAIEHDAHENCHCRKESPHSRNVSRHS